MKRYTCLIADDDKMERDILAMHLSKVGQLDIVAVCANGLEAQQALATVQTDMVFTDIDMPDLSGIGLLKTVKKPPVFVFISSHPEYAVESFDLDVVDFVVKPASLERILRSVNKAIEYIDLKRSIETPMPAAPKQENDHYFFIRESNDLVKLRFEDVAYIESMGDFSKIFTINDKRHITLVSLKNLELQLPTGSFTRIHRQYIVNHNHISAISTEELVVDGKHTLPVGQSLRQELLDKVVNKKIVTRHLAKDQH